MKTARMLLILVLALGLASVSLAAEDTWTTRADMPTARYVVSSSVVDGKIYAIGGTRGGNPCIPTVEEYDPAMDTWIRKAEMPMARGGGASSAVNGRIYVIGGTPSLYGAKYSSVQEYDATTDTWRAKANMPTPRCWLSSSVVNGKIYAFGGALTHQGGTPFSTVEEYDPTTDTWTRKADMPTARACLSTSAVNGKIYAIGGTPCNPWYRGLSTVEEYNPATNTWTKKADMPTGRTYLSTSVVNGKIYAIGGLTTSGHHLSPLEEYDPATDTWTRKADMPTARSGLSTSAVNGKIYAIGGWVSGGTAISTVEEYDTGLTVPSPDFNGDGIVDIKDLLRLIQSWGLDDPMVDIAPLLFGDGVVDTLDLELLMSNWGQPFDDPTLIAHWALDETEGIVAHDSAGDNDAYFIGSPLWLPSGGQVDGALQLDGVDDCAITGSIPNPAEGPFSVFAWVKGGAPGQAVLSQMDGARWLCADPSEGNLMTELKGAGRGAAELPSQTIITDGDWHRIALVWDGSNRTLYVDDIAVAEDTQTNLAASENGLYIGAGTAMEQGSFWSGLIDDVRIYNRAVRP